MKTDMKITKIQIFFCEECKDIKEIEYKDEFDGIEEFDNIEFLYQDINFKTEKEENFDYCEACESWFCKKCNPEYKEIQKLMIKKDITICSQNCFEEWDN